MKRILIIAAVLFALTVPSAFAAAPIQGYVEEGGGGSYGHPRIFLIAYHFPYPPWSYTCRYADFGNGLVLQLECWT